MTMRIFEVTLRAPDGGERTVEVPSKTGVQAGDAAVALARPGEAIAGIRETQDPLQQVDGLPAGTQTHPDSPM